jgi:drug/metabolite transporter (DMT)-like permease
MLIKLSLFISIFVVVLGQILLKKGLLSLGSINFGDGLIQAYIKIFTHPLSIFGVFFYILGVLFWLHALSKLDLSYAYPFLALTYVFVAFGSLIFLKEPISLLRWTGILIICIGIFIVSKS